MTREKVMREARELIAFYDEHGWDWASALGFTLCRALFGDFRIVPVNACVRMKRPGRPAKMPTLTASAPSAES